MQCCIICRIYLNNIHFLFKYCSSFHNTGRVFGALFSKLGVPIPTQIGPKVLSQARSLCEGMPTDAKYNVLKEGIPYDGSVGKQVSKFRSLLNFAS